MLGAREVNAPPLQKRVACAEIHTLPRCRLIPDVQKVVAVVMLTHRVYK